MAIMAQTERQERGYAVGVQMLDRLLERKAVSFLLLRTRRFGKSMLVDMPCCHFDGRKELFEELYICFNETKWRQYAVILYGLNCYYRTESELSK